MRDSDRDREEPPRRAGRGARFVAAFAVAGVAAAALAWPAVPEGAEARFVALALIGLAVGVGVVRRIARAPLSRTLGHAGVWLLVAALAAVGYGFRDEARYVFDRVRGDLAPEKGYGATAGEIAFRASPNGHFLVEALVEIVAGLMKTRPRAWWVENLERLSIPYGVVNDFEQVFADPHVRARGMRFDMPHHAAGSVPMVRSPLNLRGSPPVYRLPPPMLGEHTKEILRDVLGKSDKEIAALRKAGAIERREGAR